jgi:hypothetical protein
VEGLDYSETFASTAIPPTWRLLLALAAIYNYNIKQIDFIGAFLNSKLSERLYIKLPEGLKELLKKSPELLAIAKSQSYNPSEEQVILLLKALYGLKQSPRE